MTRSDPVDVVHTIEIFSCALKLPRWPYLAALCWWRRMRCYSRGFGLTGDPRALSPVSHRGNRNDD